MTTYIVPAHLSNIRLDKALAELAEISRSKAATLIKAGNISVGGKAIMETDYKLQENDEIIMDYVKVPRPEIQGADIPINIVYEDDHIIIIDKQVGLTVHPGAGNHTDTLVNALVNYYGKSLSALGGEDRPGIVHRLDRDTSGLMVVAKTDDAHAKLSEAIADRKVKRIYTALVWGNMNPESGTIETNIIRSNKDRTRMMVTDYPNGKVAITHYKMIKSFGYVSMVECQLETGRTHQIRVHMSYKKHSLVGDQTYGANSRKIIQYYSGDKKDVLSNFKRQALHSSRLEFVHPITGAQMSFQSELPEDMQVLIRAL